MKGIYFKQQTRTDCLLAVVENIVQTPREEMKDLIEWMEFNNEKYLKYESLAKIIDCKTSGYSLLGNNESYHLNYTSAIIGSVFTHNNIKYCHSYFWNGSKLYCPARDKFVHLDDIDTSYVIHRSPGSKLTDLFKQWDKNCLSKDYKKPQDRIDQLMTLVYNGRAYCGDLKRVNTNI
jgi:hypothetical protein